LIRSISDFQGWLYLPKLLERERAKLTIALQQQEFNLWLQQFENTATEYQHSINSWSDKYYEFFPQNKLAKLILSFPQPPQINILENQQSKKINFVDTIPIGLDLLKQGKVKTVILGGASYVIDVASNLGNSTESTTSVRPKINSRIYINAATDYLTQFSDRAFITLQEYELTAISVISNLSKTSDKQDTDCNYQLQLLNNLLVQLETELECLANQSRS
jgi:hypothetical protein